MTDQNHWTALPVDDTFTRRDVIGERGQRILHGDNLQAF
jgi:hypothetical protein